MKKLLAVLSLVGVLTLTGCCCGGKKSKPSHKKSHHSKSTKKASEKKASVKKAPVKKAPAKKSGAVKSELDKIWCDVCNMWTGKGHKH